VTHRAEWRYVDDEAALSKAARAMERAGVVAIDTESDSMHSYFEKVCLMQAATEDEAFIIDTLALREKMGRLAGVFGDPDIRKVLHGADYDVVCLKRDYGYEFRNIFDTMIAAQLLGIQKIGLANLVEESFGAALDKRHARTDWARRPLSASELEYSYLDVKYLIRLADEMRERLEEAGVMEEAEIEFRRLEEREPAPKEFTSDAFRKIRGARDLGPKEAAVLRELFVFRDRQARKLDRPPFKVLGNDTMLRIAREKPANAGSLKVIKGVTQYVLRRFGDAVLRAVKAGQDRGAPPPPRRKKVHGLRMSQRQQRQIDDLREWRKKVAEKEKVPTLVILPNHAIRQVVAEAPKDIQELGELSDVGRKRAERYGEAILEIIRN
jgi:ribonuclease D